MAREAAFGGDVQGEILGWKRSAKNALVHKRLLDCFVIQQRSEELKFSIPVPSWMDVDDWLKALAEFECAINDRSALVVQAFRRARRGRDCSCSLEDAYYFVSNRQELLSGDRIRRNMAKIVAELAIVAASRDLHRLDDVLMDEFKRVFGKKVECGMPH